MNGVALVVIVKNKSATQVLSANAEAEEQWPKGRALTCHGRNRDVARISARSHSGESAVLRHSQQAGETPVGSYTAGQLRLYKGDLVLLTFCQQFTG